MFIEPCEVHLKQQFTGKSAKWLFVKLEAARLPVKEAKTWADEGYYVAMQGALGETFTYWGKWRTGPNSTNSKVEEGYSLGNVPAAPKFWAYSTNKRLLVFLEMPQKKEEWPRQLTYRDGKFWGQVDGLARLTDVRITPKGIFPSGGSYGSGRCQHHSNLFDDGPIAWEAARSGAHY